MTFLYAIYHHLSAFLAARNSKALEQDKGNATLPLTQFSAPPGVAASTTREMEMVVAAISRPETPEAEHPPPLESEMEDVPRAETPPPLRDSTHEIIEMYTTESRRNPGPPSKSAPAAITTFAMADSKWTYFGQKRAHVQVQDFDFKFV